MANGTLAASQIEMLSQSGTGIITITPPATNTNRAITLPDAAGAIVVSGTTPSLNGITFPATQVASAGANTLDDYEEGTWTPSLTATGGSLSVTYTSRDGTYTKIGNLVTVRFRMRVSSHSGGSGEYRIGGLPFTAINPGSDHIGVSTLAYESHPIGSGQQLIAVIDNNTTLVRFLHSVNNAGWQSYTPASSSSVYGSFTYAA
jgi:hypothetical protein